MHGVRMLGHALSGQPGTCPVIGHAAMTSSRTSPRPSSVTLRLPSTGSMWCSGSSQIPVVTDRAQACEMPELALL